MTNKEIIRARVRDMRKEVRRGYKFALRYNTLEKMDKKIDLAFEFYRGFIIGLTWSERFTSSDLDYAIKIGTYEYCRLKSHYLKGASSLTSLEFLKQVVR